jgi:GNAT superfamily N-acetyltransferase
MAITREVSRDGITIFISDQTDVGWGNITVFTNERSTAELSKTPFPIEGLEGTVYYFNRIKVQKELEGKGRGRALMIEVCKIVDEYDITIYNELNPYGNRDMDRLKSFFKASGFEPFESDGSNVMIRKPVLFQKIVKGESDD